MRKSYSISFTELHRTPGQVGSRHIEPWREPWGACVPNISFNFIHSCIENQARLVRAISNRRESRGESRGYGERARPQPCPAFLLRTHSPLSPVPCAYKVVTRRLPQVCAAPVLNAHPEAQRDDSGLVCSHLGSLVGPPSCTFCHYRSVRA